MICNICERYEKLFYCEQNIINVCKDCIEFELICDDINCKHIDVCRGYLESNYKPFIEVIGYLEGGCIIKSLISDREIQKVKNNYQWRRNIEGSKYNEWRICKLDEGLFTAGEIQGSWRVVYAKEE